MPEPRLVFVNRFVGHSQREQTALCEVGERQIWVVERFAVEVDALHIGVLLAVVEGNDIEVFSFVVFIVEAYFHSVEDWTADAECGRVDGETVDAEQSERRDNVPSAQLTLVLILTVAVAVNSVGAIELNEDGAHPFLRE